MRGRSVNNLRHCLHLLDRKGKLMQRFRCWLGTWLLAFGFALLEIEFMSLEEYAIARKA